VENTTTIGCNARKNKQTNKRRTVKETGSFPRANAVRGQERRRGGDVLAVLQETKEQTESPVRLVYRGYRYGEVCTMMIYVRIIVKEHNTSHQEIASTLQHFVNYNKCCLTFV
jgi:hypothetical protein